MRVGAYEVEVIYCLDMCSTKAICRLRVVAAFRSL